MTDDHNGTSFPPPESAIAREDRPWAIRSIPLEVRDAAVAAAQRQRMTVGEWLTHAIRREIAWERGVSGARVDIGPATLEGEIMTPGVPALNAPDGITWKRFTLEEYKDYLLLIKQLGELRPDGKPSSALLKRFERRLREML